ncbi:MAG: putative ABC transporter permease [Clostridia bacterium]|nr:putative ABC transporter permease [Clostridia bacterium]
MDKLYTASTYILIFFVYCFIGWVWECAIKSVGARKPVNSGFLTGPWLPIYGCGAYLMLAASYPADGNPALTFIFGGAAATIMELLTGLTMEKLFAVRYWDYTKYPLNVKGYICLPVTLLWGAFSVLLVYVIHPPVAELMFGIPAPVSIPLSAVLSALFVVDFVHSTRTALSLKATLEALRSRVDMTGKLTLAAEKLGEKVSLGRESGFGLDALRRESARLSDALAERFDARIPDEERKILGEVSELLSDIKKSNAELRTRLEALKPERKSMMSLLSRSPSVKSREFGDLLQRLRELPDTDEIFRRRGKNKDDDKEEEKKKDK